MGILFVVRRQSTCVDNTKLLFGDYRIFSDRSLLPKVPSRRKNIYQTTRFDPKHTFFQIFATKTDVTTVHCTLDKPLLSDYYFQSRSILFFFFVRITKLSPTPNCSHVSRHSFFWTFKSLRTIAKKNSWLIQKKKKQ